MFEFLKMGGYAFFVWTSYAIVIGLFVYFYFSSRARKKALLSELSNEYDPDN